MARPFGYVVHTTWPPAASGWHTGSMQAFLAALVGGLLTIAGGLAAVLVTSRSARSQWRNDTQLKVSTEVLSALQIVVSRINDLAYLADNKDSDAENAWSAHVASVMEWHNARYAALLVSSSKVAALLQDIDKQADRLADLAIAKQWTLMEVAIQPESGLHCGRARLPADAGCVRRRVGVVGAAVRGGAMGAQLRAGARGRR